jgi:hypothetical protein
MEDAPVTPVRTSKLSQQQQALLVSLYRAYTSAHDARPIGAWGVPWTTTQAVYGPRPTDSFWLRVGALSRPVDPFRLQWSGHRRQHLAQSRSRCASLSRAMRRLEERGLILRQNSRSGAPGIKGPRQSTADPHSRRNTNIVLLPAGMQLARELVNKKTPENLLTVS